MKKREQQELIGRIAYLTNKRKRLEEELEDHRGLLGKHLNQNIDLEEKIHELKKQPKYKEVKRCNNCEHMILDEFWFCEKIDDDIYFSESMLVMMAQCCDVEENWELKEGTKRLYEEV